MALSMEEQRILAEIEEHLARTEPALASRLATFGKSRRRVQGRGRRLRMIASVAVLIMVAGMTLLLYALFALRAVPDRGVPGRPSGGTAPPATAGLQPGSKSQPGGSSQPGGKPQRGSKPRAGTGVRPGSATARIGTAPGGGGTTVLRPAG